MGIGLSSSFVGALYMASKWFPASRFGVMSGVTNMLGSIAGAVGSWAIAGISYQPVVLWWALANAVLAVCILFIVKGRTPNLKSTQPKEEERVGLVHMFGTLVNPNRSGWHHSSSRERLELFSAIQTSGISRCSKHMGVTSRLRHL